MASLTLDTSDAAERAVAGGVDALVRWLARRLDAGAGLVGPDGAVRAWHTTGGPGRAVLTGGIVRAAVGSAVEVVNGPDWRTYVAGTGTGGHSLIVVTSESRPGTPDDDRTLIGHAAQLAGLCLAKEVATRLPETVFRLLMSGQADAARTVAETAGHRLPDTVVVCLVEGPAGERDKTATALETSAGAWAIRCPVHARHNIVLLAATESGTADRDGTAGALARLRTAFPDPVIGASWPVHLSDVADGYLAATNALAVARREPDRMARSAGGGGLVGILGPGARRWAARELRPLLGYRPPHPRDLGGHELLETLADWLDHGIAGATGLLHIHRNTLAERVHRAGELLGADLADPSVRAALRLAMSLIAKPEAETGPVPELDELLEEPAVQHWADCLLKPLRADPDPQLLPAVRAWLEAGQQATRKAEQNSGVPSKGIRRRVERAEHLLKWLLTEGGPGPYDLYLAMMAADRHLSPLSSASAATETGGA